MNARRMLAGVLTLFIPAWIAVAGGKADGVCGTVLRPAQIARELEFINSGKSYADLPKVSGISGTELLPVAVHIVRTSAGAWGLSEADVETSLVQLNQRFEQVGWRFIRVGSIDYIDSDYFYVIPDDESRRDSLRQVNPFPGVVNIYFTHLDSLAGQSSFSADPVQGILIDSAAAKNGSTLAHEMGHYFDLLHTHETQFGYECPDGINCLIAGDLLCDTPADPNLFGRVDACVLTHTVQPPFGCGPQAYTPDVDLLMSYAPPECRSQFSSQQMAKMHLVRNTFRQYLHLPLYTYIGTMGSWHDPLNWPLGLIPQSDDTVTIMIPGTYRIFTEADVTVAAIDFRAASGKQTLAITTGTFALTSGGTVNANGIFELDGGNLSLSGGSMLTVDGEYRQTDGSLSGAGTLAIRGTGIWNSGDMSGNGGTVGITRVESGGGLSIRSGPVKRLLSRTLDIYGTVAWNDTSRFELGNSTITIQPGGTFTCWSNDTLLAGNGSGTLLIYGSFVKANSLENRTSTIGLGSNFQIVNNGVVRSEGGTLSLRGQCSSAGEFQTSSGWIELLCASLALNDGTRFASISPNPQFYTNVKGPVTLSGIVRVEPGGHARFAPNIAGSGSGTLEVAGELIWQGGQIDGSAGSLLSVLESGTLVMGDSSDCVMRQRHVEVAGTLVWRGAGNIDFSESAGIVVQQPGTIRIENDRNFDGRSGFGTSYLNNYGTIHKTLSSGTTKLGPTTTNIVITSRGLIEADSGRIEVFSGSSRNATYDAGTTATIAFLADHTFDTVAFAGRGVSRIGAQNAHYTLRGILQADSLELVNGYFRDTCTLRGQTVWIGGYFLNTSRTTIDSAGTLRFRGYNELHLDGAIVNRGTLSWHDSAGIALSSGGRITNTASGVFEIWNDRALYAVFGAGSGFLVNQGSIVKRGGTGVSYLGYMGSTMCTVNNTGTVTSNSGTIRLGNGGGISSGAWIANAGGEIEFAESHTFQAGSFFGGAGRTKFISNINNQNIFSCAGDITAYNLDMEGGTINGNWRLKGEARWIGSILNGSYTLSIDTSAMFIIDGVVDKSINSTRISNFGTIRWTGAANIRGTFGSSIWNYGPGLIEIESDSGVLHQYLSVSGFGTSSFVNFGRVRKAGGVGSTVAFGGFGSNAVDVTNSGTIEVEHSTIYFGSGYTQNVGARIVLNGGTINSPSPLTIAAGEIGGRGVFAIGLTSGATVRPGMDGTGTITILGNYTQSASGILDIQIAGADSTRYDRLKVTGNATLTGTMNLSLIDPFAPDSGTTFGPVTYISRSGAFSVIGGLDAGNGLQFTPSYAPTYLELATSGILKLPGVTTLLQPIDSADVTPDSLLFVWRKATPAVTWYRLRIATDMAFTNTVLDSLVTDTTFSGGQLQPNTTYWWSVAAGNNSGWGPAGSGRMFRTLVTGVDEGSEEEQPGARLPAEFMLHQNYPNPFNPTTVVRYELPVTAYVTLKVHNMLGQEVATLVDEALQAGRYTIVWRADGMASGIYYCRLQAGGMSATRKLILMR